MKALIKYVTIAVLLIVVNTIICFSIMSTFFSILVMAGSILGYSYGLLQDLYLSKN